MTEGNDQSDNHARQKQDIQKLLSGQSLSRTNPTTATTSSLKPDAPSTETIPNSPLREDKISLAVSFLSSAKVQSADKSKKTAFLKQKGLTNPEIEEAYRRTNTTDAKETSTQVTTPLTTPMTPVSSLPPVVPTRVAPTRPTQIVYYSQPEPERLTGKRMLALALIFGAGAVGLTAGLVSLVKALISPIFNSISGYQRNRYNDRYDKLQRLGDTLRQQLIRDVDDESETTKSTGYWSTLITEQKKLMDRLDHLVGVSQKHVSDEQEPYGKFKNTLLDLKEVLNRPEYNFSTYTPYSMYGSTFANRSNTGFDDSAVQGVKSEIRSFKGMLLSRRNFPTAQIKPLPSVASTKDNKGENDTSITPPASYHPRQRQNSYRAELQAKAKATETNTTIADPPQTNASDTAVTETKGKAAIIEDITEADDN